MSRKEKPKQTQVKPLAGIVGNCPQIKSIFDTVQKVAWSPTASILILGESGTGKELIARAIHESGPFADQPFVEINCSALPDNLIETELFGYEAGAFTDAKKTKKGLLELADGGTFFMDEIGDLNLNLQVKLVKALEEKTFRRVGGIENIRVTMRIMAATNRDLVELIREGRFREDLFYRLNVVAIHAPPLRERQEDIVVLAEHFLNLASEEHVRAVKGFSAKARKLLLSYPWPGNVRELKNAVERAVLLGSDSKIESDDLQLGSGHIVENYPTEVRKNGRIQIEIPPQGISLMELEAEAIKKAMRMANGNLSKAARLLHVTRETLRYRIKKFKVA